MQSFEYLILCRIDEEEKEISNMSTLVVMCIGIIVGNRLLSDKHKRKNEYLQTVCIVLLIFSMGVMLGARENFLQELLSVGFQSILFCLIPSVLSLFLVYFLTKRFMNRNNSKERGDK